MLSSCIPLNGHMEFYIYVIADLMKSSTTQVDRILLFASPIIVDQVINLWMWRDFLFRF